MEGWESSNPEFDDRFRRLQIPLRFEDAEEDRVGFGMTCSDVTSAPDGSKMHEEVLPRETDV